MVVKNYKELTEVVEKEFKKNDSNINKQISEESNSEMLGMLLSIKDDLDKLKYIDFSNANKSLIEFNYKISYDLMRNFNTYLKLKYSNKDELITFIRLQSIIDWEIELRLNN